MSRAACLLTATLLTTAALHGASAGGYIQSNLTSDLPGMADRLDPNLVNPWGIAAGSGPFWTADNGTGLSTLYNGLGVPQPLVVTIPPAPGSNGPADPTGIVFNTGAAGGSFGGAPFIFVTESGTVAAWNSGPAARTTATGDPGSVYKGLGINSSGDRLYGANFGLGRIDIFDSSFTQIRTPGAFFDPSLPTGYAPFNVQNINGNLYVAYARSEGGRDEVDGPGLGYVDIYSADGVLLRRFISQGALNAPWGVALAPATGFGEFSGDLLVGNFGDGTINAYLPNTGEFAGTLSDANGDPIVIPGLWGISFGNGAVGQNRNTLYFNAGIAGPDDIEDHGLFGALNPVPEPRALGLALTAFLAAHLLRHAYQRHRP